jgi:flagellar basal body P-ring protein FlgI
MPIIHTLRCLLFAAIIATLVPGCQKIIAPSAPATPPPTYKGPDFLQGTIGSVTTVRGFEPMLVSGFGLVTSLANTGSADIPPELRQWFLDELGKRGFGRHETGYGDLTPTQVLASDTTAVVMVEALIPPGSVAGDRFDLLVSSLPQTQTTSLEGGLLYSTDLRIGGIRLGPTATPAYATGRGWLLMNPFTTPAPAESGLIVPENLQGIVPAGGLVTRTFPIELHTHQPSYRLTKQIADRINARFAPKKASDRLPAVAKTDSVVEVTVPDAYRESPQRFVDIISTLFLNPTNEYAISKAREMAGLLNDPAQALYADAISAAWVGMGKHVLGVIRPLYTHDQLVVRLAALSAGAQLEDAKAADPLFKIASDNLGVPSEQATRRIADLLRARPDFASAVAMLRSLASSTDARVRIAAFRGLAAVNDPAVRRWPFPDKLELASIESKSPMIHVTRQGVPRISVFDQNLSLDSLALFSALDGRFMIRAAPDNQLSIFYRPAPNARPVTYTIPNNLSYLIGVMAYQPDPIVDKPSPGLDMTYHQIVHVLFHLTQQGVVKSPLVLEPSDLIERVTQGRISDALKTRPENETPARPENSESPVAP